MCDYKHDEIVYDDSILCPLCEAMERADELRDEISELDQNITDLEGAIDSRDNEIKELNDEIRAIKEFNE